MDILNRLFGNPRLRAEALCSLFGHRRSRSSAFREGERWISYCKRCGTKVVRTGPGAWSAADDR